MDPVWCIVAATFSAFVSAGLTYFVMQSRMEVRLARQREKLAAANGALGVRMEMMEDSLLGAKESGRRGAIDELLADLFVEERHYVREYKGPSEIRRCIVRQERIRFRNLPLSNWVEKEMPIREGADIDQRAGTIAIFISDVRREEIGPKRLGSRHSMV